MSGSRWAVRPVRRSMVAGSALLAVLAACADDQPTVAELLTDACAQARDSIAGAPAPADDDSEERFVEATRDAAEAAAGAAHEVAGRGDDATIADMAWQLDRIPGAAQGRSLAMSQEAAAAITRLDEFADRLQIPECRAQTWRPEAWRTIADRHADRLPQPAFRRRLDRLCADTFPDPSLLEDGVPLLDALVADANPRSAQDDVSEQAATQLIARLHTLRSHPSDMAQFLRDFSAAQPQIRPPEELEDEHVALIAAFIDVQSAVPRAMPRDPPPEVRERVGAALNELQRSWEALDITCRA